MSLGMRLIFSTTHRPQTNKQTKRVNQMIEDMLKAYCLDKGVTWIDVLPLMKFVYNNSYQMTIQMVLYKALYRRTFA